MTEKKTPPLNLYNSVPVIIKLKKFVKEGDSQYGHYYLWAVIKEGVEFVFFPNEETHKKFLEKGEGATLQLTKNDNNFEVADADNNARAGEREFLFNDVQNAKSITTQSLMKFIEEGDDIEKLKKKIDLALEGTEYLISKIKNND